MGKKGCCFGLVKSKVKKTGEEKWGLGKSKPTPPSFAPQSETSSDPLAPPPPPLLVPSVDVKRSNSEIEQNRHVYSAALATAEAAVAAAQAAAEVVRLTATTARFSGKSREETAAIKIQTAFRGYMARRSLQSLRGLVRLKFLMDGDAVKCQATATLRRAQTFTIVQSEIRSRRIRMIEENQALQKQLQLKRERELETLKAAMGEDWDDSLQSKEQIQASIMGKHEAAARRERGLAYAFTHQWKSSSRSMNPVFMDPNNPEWGWSWIERWMASRPWESRVTTEKEVANNHISLRSASHGVVGEIAKAYARRDISVERTSPGAQKQNRPVSRQSPSTPQSRASSVAGGRIKAASPRGGWGSHHDDESRSLFSAQSERTRRTSIAGSSMRDDESLTSSPTVPNYMTPTESAKAKSRFQSPSSDKVVTPDRASTGSVKKRLSFPASDKPSMLSPATTRRHSGPPKVEVSSVKDIMHSATGGSDGGKRLQF